MKKEIMLLLSATFGIAGLITYWGNTLVSETLTTAENISSDIDCPNALFTLHSGRYESSTKNLILILDNKRSIDLRLENIYIIYPGGTMETFELNKMLEGNSLLSVEVTDIDDGFERGKVKSNCPEISVDFTYSQVT